LSFGAKLQLHDFKNIENFVNKIVSDEFNKAFPDFNEWKENEKNQVFFSQIASLNEIHKVLNISDKELVEFKTGRSVLTLDQLTQLVHATAKIREEWVQKYIKHLTLQKPPKSRTYMLTVESMKGIVSVQIAFLGGVLMGTGIVPFDSNLGEFLGPVSILASIYAVTRPLKIAHDLSKIEIDTLNFNKHLETLHKNSDLKVPHELLSLEFIVQVLKQIEKPKCTNSLEIKDDLQI